MTHRQNISKER